MLPTLVANQRNRRQALIAALLVAWAACLLCWAFAPFWTLLALTPYCYWRVRRREAL